MGRIQADVDPAAGPRLRALVAYLRQLKKASGATFRELSTRTEAAASGCCAASALSEAATGSRVPRLTVVEAFARAADPLTMEQARPSQSDAQAFPAWEQRRARARHTRAATARQLWDAARVEQARA